MRGRPRKFDQDQALEKATQLFLFRGFEGAGLNDLLEHMGIARQSLYRTFGDKKSLFVSALRVYGKSHMGELRSMLQGPGSPMDNLLAMLAAMRERATQPEFRGCLLANSLAEFGDQDEHIAQVLRELITEFEAIFFDGLQAAQDQGELAPSLNIRAWARTLTSVANGLSVLGKLHPGEAFMADVMDTVVGTLGGLRTPVEAVPAAAAG